MAKLTPGRVPARVYIRQSREHYRFDPPNLLLTTLKAAAAIAVVAVAVRSTTFTDYNAPKQPTVFQPPNTLLTLLAPPKAALPPPFRQQDWPNPAKPWQRDLTWIDTPSVIPQVPDVAVANRIPNQTDWPNPQRRWIRDLTWTQSPAVPPAPSLPAVPAPFAQEDWPNPLRSPIRDLTWTQSPKVQQIVPGAAVAEGQRAHGFTDYFARQQPVVFDPPNTLALLTQPVVVAPAGTVKPFFQGDWPNPVARIPFRESGWIKFANIGDIPAQPTPPPQAPPRSHGFTDYAAPRQTVQFDPPNTLLAGIPAQPTPPPVVVVSTPFNQEDWPNPRLRPLRIKTPEAFRPALDSPTVTSVAVSSSFPFSQEDWPNPVRRVSPREWGFTRFANVSDIPQRFIAPAPFDQTDWPNPLTPWRRDLTWLQSPQVQPIPATIIPPSPFAQLDWPNPAKPWQRDLNWNQSPQVQQIVPDPAGSTFPFSLLDQPNPVLRTPFNESGWVRFANIGDIPAAAPPVPVPPASVDEVKPSGGRVRHEPVHHAGTIDPEFRYAIEGRKTYAQKLQDLRIAQEAAQVIEQVALQQAATLEVNEAKNARELKRALRVAQLEDDARYLELLAERRELAKTEEIGALLYKAVRDEEDILALLMIAAQLL